MPKHYISIVVMLVACVCSFVLFQFASYDKRADIPSNPVIVNPDAQIPVKGPEDSKHHAKDKDGAKWRYKITVVVDTPEGEKTGSAVREIRSRKGMDVLLNSGRILDLDVIGEGVVVDLGDRGKLFSMMNIDGSSKILFEAFAEGRPPGKALFEKEYAAVYNNIGDKQRKVSPTMFYFPDFVMFKDPEDPKSIEPVLIRKLDGYEAQMKKKVVTDRFEELFGLGVALKEVTIQLSDEEITQKIESHLPPFGQETGYQEWRRSLPYGDPKLFTGHFVNKGQ